MQSEWITGFAYFQDATPEQLAAVAGIIRECSFAKGETMIAPQDKPNMMYIIREGLAMVTLGLSLHA